MKFLTQMSKYVLFISLILNGILLIFLAGPVQFFLYLSIIINAVLVWYSTGLLARTSEMEEDMQSILTMTETFSDHVEEIHSLEMYYGDQDLQNMIEHSRTLINDMINMQEKYFEVEVTTEEEQDDSEAETETPAQETQE